MCCSLLKAVKALFAVVELAVQVSATFSPFR